MINPETPRVKRVIAILDAGMPDDILIQSEDVQSEDAASFLTAPEITKLIRYLEEKKPRVAKLIRKIEGDYSRELKFPIRGTIIEMLCLVAHTLAEAKKPRRFKQL